MKITIFKMDHKFAAKFETGLFEQTYKFRESETLFDLESMQQLISPAFQQEVLDLFKVMNNTRKEAFNKMAPPAPSDEFDEII